MILLQLSVHAGQIELKGLGRGGGRVQTVQCLDQQVPFTGVHIGAEGE